MTARGRYGGRGRCTTPSSVEAGVKLSPAQTQLLAEVREHGERRYNGRATRTIEFLESLGLVETDYTFRIVTGGRTTALWTVRPAKVKS